MAGLVLKAKVHQKRVVVNVQTCSANRVYTSAIEPRHGRRDQGRDLVTRTIGNELDDLPCLPTRSFMAILEHADHGYDDSKNLTGC